MSKSMEEESISEVDDYDDISSDSNGAHSVDRGGITNSSDVEEDMVNGLHAEDSADDESDEDSSDKQLEGSNTTDTDDEYADDEVDIDNQCERDIREEEEDGFFDGVEEDDGLEEDGADDNE